MKKTAKAAAASIVLMTAFFSCSDTTDNNTDASLGFSIANAKETKSAEYKSDFPIFEVASDTKTLTISGVESGKSIYLAKVNTGDATVPIKYLRSVQVGSGSSRSANVELSEIDESALDLPQSEFKHFKGEKIDLEDVQNAARSARASSSERTVTPTDYEVGGTNNTKEIYVDNNVNMSAYSKKTAKLYAEGNNCYVWVVESDFTKQGKTTTDMTTVATEFKDKFEAFYPMITNVFGHECNNLIDSLNTSVSSLKDAASIKMSEQCDTGEKINIVIYDIGSDYKKSSQCGVLGYFYAKDYFTRVENTSSVIKYSNEGKYFYIDAIYAADEKTRQTTISTLAHEFQHMVNYGVKDLGIGETPDTAYNEMLSMLCEDMMAKQLFEDDADSNGVKSERLPYFNSSYFLSGIREYRNDSYAALSYSTSYGFGSWLCRQYGGAELVKKIMENEYVDDESLVEAVTYLKGKPYTFDDLFKQFLIACTNRGETSGYTHNQNAGTTLTYDSSSYDYPMTAINLWGNDYKRTAYLVSGQSSAAYNNDSDKTGPFLFSKDYGCALRPNYGMTLHKLGETTGEDVSLTFGDSGADCVTMYVIIQ